MVTVMVMGAIVLVTMTDKSRVRLPTRLSARLRGTAVGEGFVYIGLFRFVHSRSTKCLFAYSRTRQVAVRDSDLEAR